MTVNPGIWVRQILANPSKTKGKYADVAPEILSFGEMLKIWSEVSGKDAEFIQCTAEEFTRLWGAAGDEMAQQLRFGEGVEGWHAHVPFVTMEELGIGEEEAPGIRRTLEGLKDLL